VREKNEKEKEKQNPKSNRAETRITFEIHVGRGCNGKRQSVRRLLGSASAPANGMEVISLRFSFRILIHLLRIRYTETEEAAQKMK
jgi:hypothetical protein